MAFPSLTQDEQDSLVRAIREERPGAFEKMYGVMYARVFNLAARIVNDPEEAADITQEVFLDALRQIPDHSDHLRLEPWLYRIAMNTSYDHLRRRATRATAPLGDIENALDPADFLEHSLLSSTVVEALGRMTPRYRAALVLKDVHGVSNSELAQALDVSIGAAGVLLFRARAAFRRAFRELAPAGVGSFSAHP